MDFLYFRFLLVVIVLSTTTKVCAQKQSTVWYFGEGAGINFNKFPVEVLATGNVSAQEACASVADEDGNLLFYTDGITIHNRNNVVMANGRNLSGSKSTTQMAVVHCPGNYNLYYVFTIAEFGGALSYSIVNMADDSGLGAVISKNNLLLNAATEKVTTAMHANGEDVWLVAEQAESNKFYAWKVSENGVSSTPVITAAGSVCTGSFFKAIGALKVSLDGKLLASTGNNDNGGFAEVFKFDAATGVMSDPRKLTGFTDQHLPYGVEFSPNNKFLYITEYDTDKAGNLYQVPLPAFPGNIKLNSFVLGSLPSLGMLQLAPDGKIYLTQNTTSQAKVASLHVINLPDEGGLASDFRTNAVYLKGKIPKLGLPQMVLEPNQNNSFIYNGDCSAESTSFHLLAYVSSYNNIVWTFDDPGSGNANTSTERDPDHLFTHAGTFNVKVVFFSNGSNRVLSRMITISPPITSKPVLTTDKPILCENGVVTINAAGANGAQKYSWYSKDMAFIEQNSGQFQTPLLDQPATYFAAISNGTCEGEFQRINIDMKRVEARITASSQFVERGESITLSANIEPGLSYEWKPSTYLDNTNHQQVVSTPLQDITYTLTVTNTFGCSKSATISVAVKSAVTIPNVFTPNADGTNDLWVIKNIDRFKNNVRVYDRSGALVYECRNYRTIGTAIAMANPSRQGFITI